MFWVIEGVLGGLDGFGGVLELEDLAFFVVGVAVSVKVAHFQKYFKLGRGGVIIDIG